MPKFTFSFLPALLIAALCLPAIGAAQTDPGSLELDYPSADVNPLQEQNAQPSTDLHAPLVIVPPVPNLPASQPSEVIPPPLVLDAPRIAIDEPAPGELVLPDLTIPTPENTTVDPLENQRSLKPQFEVQPQAQIEPALPQPRLQSPQALNYGSRAYLSRSRIQIVPLQVQVYSVNRGYGYQPYGGYGGYGGYRSGYRSSYRSGYGSSYRPGSYGGYGGGSRYCPYGR